MGVVRCNQIVSMFGKESQWGLVMDQMCSPRDGNQGQCPHFCSKDLKVEVSYFPDMAKSVGRAGLGDNVRSSILVITLRASDRLQLLKKIYETPNQSAYRFTVYCMRMMYYSTAPKSVDVSQAKAARPQEVWRSQGQLLGPPFALPHQDMLLSQIRNH